MIPEKICRKHTVMFDRPGRGRWWKRWTAKWHRRLAKKDPENAPKRPMYHGWSD